MSHTKPDPAQGRTRTPLEPAELITHVLARTEREKAEIARKLHDELGGLLVAAVMDVAWSEQHLHQLSDAGRQRLRRIRVTLDAAIDLKRKLIEELRPTLLENVGLYAALGWQLNATCAEAGFLCSVEFPSTEPTVGAETAIAIFRIVQDALLLVTLHRGVTRTSLRAEIAGPLIVLYLSNDGTIDESDDAADRRAQTRAYLTHRVHALSGAVEVSTTAQGTVLRVELALSPKTAGLDDSPQG